MSRLTMVLIINALCLASCYGMAFNQTQLETSGTNAIPWLWNTRISYHDVEIAAATPLYTTTLKPDIVVGTLSGINNRDLRDAVRRTWALSQPAGLDIMVWFLVGAPDSQDDEVIQEAYEYNDIMFVNIADGFASGQPSSLPVKVSAWLQLSVALFPETGWHMKTDDDTFPLFSVLWKDYLKAHPGDAPVLAGAIHRNVKVIRDPTNRYFVPESLYPKEYWPDYASGAGYILSRQLLQWVREKILREWRPSMNSEDIDTGLMLEACEPYDSRDFTSNNIGYTSGNAKQELGRVLVHGIKAKGLMDEFWELNGGPTSGPRSETIMLQQKRIVEDARNPLSMMRVVPGDGSGARSDGLASTDQVGTSLDGVSDAGRDGEPGTGSAEVYGTDSSEMLGAGGDARPDAGRDGEPGPCGLWWLVYFVPSFVMIFIVAVLFRYIPHKLRKNTTSPGGNTQILMPA